MLAIEDDPHIFALPVRVPTPEGYDAHAVANRTGVLTAPRRLPLPDPVLINVHLPETNSFEMLERMKQHPCARRFPSPC